MVKALEKVREFVDTGYRRTMKVCEKFDRDFEETGKRIEQFRKEMENREWRLLKSR